MTASGGDNPEWTAITDQLAGSTECSSESAVQKAFYGEGPDIILHCNRKYGHDGDHEFATTWPRDEKERP